jgi:hypothetical protein
MVLVYEKNGHGHGGKPSHRNTVLGKNPQILAANAF